MRFGRVVGTVVRGRTAMWEAELADAGEGEAIRFASNLSSKTEGRRA